VHHRTIWASELGHHLLAKPTAEIDSHQRVPTAISHQRADEQVNEPLGVLWQALGPELDQKPGGVEDSLWVRLRRRHHDRFRVLLLRFGAGASGISSTGAGHRAVTG
jgi:hypothetical protein